MKRAFLIASSEFPDDPAISQLRFPLNDVNEMEKTLSAPGFDFAVTKLVNRRCSDVMEQLETWISKSAYDDLILIYFSGHGKLSRTRELCLTCANTKEANLHATSLKFKWLMEVIKDHSLQKVAILLDCCYAGQALSSSGGTARGAIEEQVRSATEGHGHFFLGASGSNQTAEERESEGLGRFTKHIVAGLSSGDADIDADGQISAKDLSTYVKRQLRSENASQEPIEGGGYQGELILGGNRRKQLETFVTRILGRLDARKQDFSRVTFRAIEDYLDQVKAATNIDTVISDERYVVLQKYSLEAANLEEVVTAFLAGSGSAGLTRLANEEKQAETAPLPPTQAISAPSVIDAGTLGSRPDYTRNEISGRSPPKSNSMGELKTPPLNGSLVQERDMAAELASTTPRPVQTRTGGRTSQQHATTLRPADTREGEASASVQPQPRVLALVGAIALVGVFVTIAADSAPEGAWYAALGAGSILLGIYFWFRFDEPSYAGLLGRYEPCFMTSSTRYRRAKLAYVLVTISVYCFVSVIPEVIHEHGAKLSTISTITIFAIMPLLIALGFVSLGQIRLLQPFEKSFRALFHSAARVPVAVQRTVNQMHICEFVFDPSAVEAQTLKLGIQKDHSVSLPQLVRVDEAINAWYVVGCILFGLSEGSGKMGGKIHRKFLARYAGELNKIQIAHSATSSRVKERIDSWPNIDALAFLDQISRLRDRIYAFLAAGAHSSSQQTGSDTLEILHRAGFKAAHFSWYDDSRIRVLAKLALVSVLVLSIFTVISTKAFEDHVLSSINQNWRPAFPLPPELGPEVSVVMDDGGVLFRGNSVCSMDSKYKSSATGLVRFRRPN